MRRLIVAAIIVVPLAWSAPETETKHEKDGTKKSAPAPSAKPRSGADSRTGCLDQQGETYVLRELKSAGAILALQGKAFSDDNFARYVGHKVTVHGTTQKDGEKSVMHVTKIDDAGPGCSGQ